MYYLILYIFVLFFILLQCHQDKCSVKYSRSNTLFFITIWQGISHLGTSVAHLFLCGAEMVNKQAIVVRVPGVWNRVIVKKNLSWNASKIWLGFLFCSDSRINHILVFTFWCLIYHLYFSDNLHAILPIPHTSSVWTVPGCSSTVNDDFLAERVLSVGSRDEYCYLSWWCCFTKHCKYI